MSKKSKHIARSKTAPSATAIQVQSMFNEALMLHQAGQLVKAQKMYEEILDIQPKHYDSLHLLGVIAYQTNNYQHSVHLIDKAIELFPASAVFYSNRGIALLELEQLDAAVANYDNAIALTPDYAEAYSNRGNALLILNQFEAALASYDKAVALNPDYADAHYNQGVVLKVLKQFDSAVASYDKAIVLKPDYAEANYNRGNTLKELEQLEGALANYDKAIALKPDFAEALLNRGITLQDLNQPVAALLSYDLVITSKPDYAEIYHSRGNVLKGLHYFEGASVSYAKAILLKPDYAEAYCNRGITQQELQQLDGALISYDMAIALKPDFAEAYSNRGNALKELNLFDGAVASYDTAIEIKPDYAEAYYNRGIALHELKRLDAAVECYDKAIALKPDYGDANWNKSLALLLDGDFVNGWEIHEWRWQLDTFTSPKRNFTKPLWLGNESLNGKTILLHSEQGHGDTIQFCRYARLVAELGARVILEVPDAMLDLFKSLDSVAELVAKDEMLPAFDFHCPLLSLPLAFKTNISNIPTAQAYLRSDPGKVNNWESKLGDKTTKRIGLVWSGSITHKNDHNRSIILSQLLPYLPNDYDYISLQKELREIDKSTLSQSKIRHYGDELTDFADTAALCGLMDIVISVDTSVAHLAGALGKQTWVLLPFCPDWRWLLERSDSIWYPSVRLYRQNALADWTNVLKELREDLLQTRDSFASRRDSRKSFDDHEKRR